MNKQLGQIILNSINEIAKEKKINSKNIFDALKKGVKKAYEYQNYDHKNQNIEITINENNGIIQIFKKLIIVKRIKNPDLEIDLKTIQKNNLNLKIGDIYYKQIILDNSFSRLSIFKAIQFVKQSIREAEKISIYDEFISKKDQILIGIIENIQKNYILIKINRIYAILPKKNQIPNEISSQNNLITHNNYIKFYVEDILKNKNEGHILASRTHNNFLKCLLQLEVPEIAQGVIEIKDIARIPGIRSKISVFSHDSSIDSIGACIGIKGERTKIITNELNGEKIDIIAWSSNIKNYIINALTPAKVISININENLKKANIIVPTEQLSLAIGKNGISAKLVANLTHWNINIISLKYANENNIQFNWNGNIKKDEYDNFICEILKKIKFKKNKIRI